MPEFMDEVQLKVDRNQQRLTIQIPYGEGAVQALKMEPYQAAQLAKSLLMGAIYCGWKPDGLPPKPQMDIENSPTTEEIKHG